MSVDFKGLTFFCCNCNRDAVELVELVSNVPLGVTCPDCRAKHPFDSMRSTVVQEVQFVEDLDRSTVREGKDVKVGISSDFSQFAGEDFDLPFSRFHTVRFRGQMIERGVVWE